MSYTLKKVDVILLNGIMLSVVRPNVMAQEKNPKTILLNFFYLLILNFLQRCWKFLLVNKSSKLIEEVKRTEQSPPAIVPCTNLYISGLFILSVIKITEVKISDGKTPVACIINILRS